MFFFEALYQVVKNTPNNEHLFNPFHVYAMLSDFCKESLIDKGMVKRYYFVNQRVNFYELFVTYGVDWGEEIIRNKYVDVSDLVSKEEFQTFILDTRLSIVMQ